MDARSDLIQLSSVKLKVKTLYEYTRSTSSTVVVTETEDADSNSDIIIPLQHSKHGTVPRTRTR